MESPLTETLKPGSIQYQNGRLSVTYSLADPLNGIEWQIFGMEPRRDPDILLENKWLGQLGRQGWRLVQVENHDRIDEDEDHEEDESEYVTTYYLTRRVR